MTKEQITVLILFVIINQSVNGLFFNNQQRNNKMRCPKVKALRNFNIAEMMGSWYVVQYYASSEETPQYGCMKSIFSESLEDRHVTMNFTYVFIDDPLKEILQGNITWVIPNFAVPGHWIHTEDDYEGIYNTYIIDTDYTSFGLLMHCAEKAKTPRYLSALLLSREPTLGINVVNFLREKLPIYDIDTSFMFPIDHSMCKNSTEVIQDDTKLEYQFESIYAKQHPLNIIPQQTIDDD